MAHNKATHKNKITMNGRTSIIEFNMFPSFGHIVYSGFGVHTDKLRNANRRNRKIEEKRVKMGVWD